MSAADSTAALIGTAAVAGAVAAFYYTTQRTDLRVVVSEAIPFGDDLTKALRRRLRRKLGVVVVVLLLHLPLTVLFVLAALNAIGSIDFGQSVDPVKVAVVVVAGLALLHA